MRRIGGVFGRNPFSPLYEHLCKAADCLRLTADMMAAFVSAEFERADKLAEEVHQSEGAADLVKNEIKRSLPVSFLRAAARTEILIALEEQDDMADACRDVATFVSMRASAFPPKVCERLKELTDAVSGAFNALEDFSRRLSARRGTPVNRRELRALNDMLDALHEREFEVCKARERVLKTLFRHEADIDPVTIVIGIELAKELAEVAHAAENAGDSLRRLIDLKH